MAWGWAAGSNSPTDVCFVHASESGCKVGEQASAAANSYYAGGDPSCPAVHPRVSYHLNLA